MESELTVYLIIIATVVAVGAGWLYLDSFSSESTPKSDSKPEKELHNEEPKQVSEIHIEEETVFLEQGNTVIDIAKEKSDVRSEETVYSVQCSYCGTLFSAASEEKQLLKGIDQPTQVYSNRKLISESDCTVCINRPDPTGETFQGLTVPLGVSSQCTLCRIGLINNLGLIPRFQKSLEDQFRTLGISQMCIDCQRERLIHMSDFQDSEPKLLFGRGNEKGTIDWCVSIPIDWPVFAAPSKIGEPETLLIGPSRKFSRSGQPFPTIIKIQEHFLGQGSLVFPKSVDEFKEYIKTKIRDGRIVIDSGGRYTASKHSCEEMDFGGNAGYQSFYVDHSIDLTMAEWLIETENGFVTIEQTPTDPHYDLAAPAEEIAYSFRSGPFPHFDDSGDLDVIGDSQGSFTLENNNSFYCAVNISIWEKTTGNLAKKLSNLRLPKSIDAGEKIEVISNDPTFRPGDINNCEVRWQWTLPEYQFLGRNLNLGENKHKEREILYENEAYPEINGRSIFLSYENSSRETFHNFALQNQVVDGWFHFGPTPRMEPDEVHDNMIFYNCDFRMGEAHLAPLMQVVEDLHISIYYHQRFLFEECEFREFDFNREFAASRRAHWIFGQSRIVFVDCQINCDLTFMRNANVVMRNCSIKGNLVIEDSSEVSIINSRINDSNIFMESGARVFVSDTEISDSSFIDSYRSSKFREEWYTSPSYIMPSFDEYPRLARFSANPYGYQRFHLENCTNNGEEIEQLILQPYF